MLFNGRTPVVGVMGSGNSVSGDLSAQLGRWIAIQGFHLLTGGGAGEMAAVCQAFAESPGPDNGTKGLSIGILPGNIDEAGDYEPFAGYPNPWVDIVIRTHLPKRGSAGGESMSRNHINILSADVVIALPGGPGTASEVSLALQYGRPVIGFAPRGFNVSADGAKIPVTDDIDGVASFIRSALPANVP